MAQLQLKNYIGCYPPSYHIRESTAIKFYLDNICQRMPTLNSNRRKKAKPCASTLPIQQARKWQRFSSLTTEKLKQLSKEGRKFFEDDARCVWQQCLCDQCQEAKRSTLSLVEREDTIKEERSILVELTTSMISLHT